MNIAVAERALLHRALDLSRAECAKSDLDGRENRAALSSGDRTNHRRVPSLLDQL